MKIPNHSTIAAYGALFVALGGTSYAATQLPAHSVGTTQLRNGAVTKAKLAKGAQPLTQARVAHLVTDTVATTLTSDQVLSALAVAVQGQPGIKGDQGPNGPEGASGAPGAPGTPGAPGQQGADGPKGDQGAQGAAGSPIAKAYGHVTADGSGTIESGTIVSHPGLGAYCMDDHGFIAVTATPDSFNATVFALPPTAPNGSCGPNRWTVVVDNNSGVDTGFYFTAN